MQKYFFRLSSDINEQNVLQSNFLKTIDQIQDYIQNNQQPEIYCLCFNKRACTHLTYISEEEMDHYKVQVKNQHIIQLINKNKRTKDYDQNYCYYVKLRVPLSQVKQFCDFAYFCQHNNEEQIKQKLEQLKNNK